MKTVENIEEYIRKKAKEHAVAEDEWEYESIEIDSFRSIIRFLLTDGFVVKGIDYDVLLDGYDEEESDKDPDKDHWYYFQKLREIMDEMISEETLPPQAKHLYLFWQDALWGQYH